MGCGEEIRGVVSCRARKLDLKGDDHGSTAFDIFVQQEQEKTKGLDSKGFAPQKEKQEWLQSIDNLYRMLSAYLQDYVSAGQIAVSYREMTINEKYRLLCSSTDAHYHWYEGTSFRTHRDIPDWIGRKSRCSRACFACSAHASRQPRQKRTGNGQGSVTINGVPDPSPYRRHSSRIGFGV